MVVGGSVAVVTILATTTLMIMVIHGDGASSSTPRRRLVVVRRRQWEWGAVALQSICTPLDVLARVSLKESQVLFHANEDIIVSHSLLLNVNSNGNSGRRTQRRPRPGCPRSHPQTSTWLSGCPGVGWGGGGGWRIRRSSDSLDSRGILHPAKPSLRCCFLVLLSFV